MKDMIRALQVALHIFMCCAACALGGRVDFDASGQIPALVSAQEMVGRSQVATVAVNAFGCVAMCSVSPKKAQRELKPTQFVCQCEDQLTGFAGFVGDIQEAKKQLRHARDVISRRTGVSATVSQSAGALADAMMRSSTAEGRPLIVTTLLAGLETVGNSRRPVLYHVGVAGDFRALKAGAIGTGAEGAVAKLREHAKLMGGGTDMHNNVRRRQTLAAYLAMTSLFAGLAESEFDEEKQNLELAVLSAPGADRASESDSRWEANVRPFTSPVVVVPRPVSMLRMAPTRTNDVLAWHRSTSSKLSADVLASQQSREKIQIEEIADIAT